MTYGGEFVSQTALLTIHVGLQEMSIPLHIVNVNGQVRHLLVDQYPVDVAFTPRRIELSYFVENVRSSPDISSVVLQDTTVADQLRLPMTTSQRDALVGAVANICLLYTSPSPRDS